MLIPCWTDAELRHWPFATIALIIINIFAFMIQLSLPPIEIPADPSEPESAPSVQDMIDDLRNRSTDVEDFQQRLNDREVVQAETLPGWWPYALSHGDGLHPIQWFTSFFIHGGIFHLLGNLIFLWAFGLVVEGRIGPALFTVLYLGMGIFQNIVEQVIFLPFEAMPSLGASSAIYAVMMLAMLWAPQDNLKAFIMVFYRPFFFDIPILILAALYFLIDFGACLASGFGMGTGLLHVMGAIVGIVVGVVFLTFQWVDCNDRDVFSMVMQASGKERKKKTRKPTRQELEQQTEQKEQQQQRIDTIRKSIQMHLDADNFPAAIGLMKQLRRMVPDANWTPAQLARLISWCSARKDWDSMIDYSSEYLEKYGADPSQTATVSTVRINLAKIYLVEKGLPRRALKTIEPVDSAQLPDSHQQLIRRIVATAKKQIAEGAIELED